MIPFETVLTDGIQRTQREWRPILTDFVPRGDVMTNQEILWYSGVRYRIDGGYDEAERVRVCLSVIDEDILRSDMDICVISFVGNMKFTNYNHRDCLGALMSLGFERKCIGDIFVTEKGFDVLTNHEIGAYLLMQKLSVKHVPMRAQKLELTEWEAPKRNYQDLYILVPQMRLDAIVAKVFALSRNDVTELIRHGNVQIDYVESLSPSKICKEGQVISVRGYGKFLIGEPEGLSKKGKLRLLIKKYA